MGSSPGPGRSHMSRSNWACAPQLESGPRSRGQLEKAHVATKTQCSQQEINKIKGKKLPPKKKMVVVRLLGGLYLSCWLERFRTFHLRLFLPFSRKEVLSKLTSLFREVLQTGEWTQSSPGPFSLTLWNFGKVQCDEKMELEPKSLTSSSSTFSSNLSCRGLGAHFEERCALCITRWGLYPQSGLPQTSGVPCCRMFLPYVTATRLPPGALLWSPACPTPHRPQLLQPLGTFRMERVATNHEGCRAREPSAFPPPSAARRCLPSLGTQTQV